MMAVKINPAEVPKLEARLFCLALAEAAERFYGEKCNEAAFQDWLKQQQIKAAAEQAN